MSDLWLQTKKAEASSQTEWEASKVVSSQLHAEGNFEILNIFSLSSPLISISPSRYKSSFRWHRERATLNSLLCVVCSRCFLVSVFTVRWVCGGLGVAAYISCVLLFMKHVYWLGVCVWAVWANLRIQWLDVYALQVHTHTHTHSHIHNISSHQCNISVKTRA